jgi:circadian clock protein KaiB
MSGDPTLMSGDPTFSFRLYVAGDGENSTRAIANLTVMCRAHLAGRHRIEVIDVFGQPERALADRVVMTPMLIRLEPGPVRRLVGTLQATDVVTAALGVGGRVA